MTIKDTLAGRNPTRREVLAALGAGATSGLAGCGGNGDGDPSASEETDSGTPTDTSGNGSGTANDDVDTDDTTDQTTKTQNAGDDQYPTQESSGFEKRLEGVVEDAGAWGIKIDDYDYFNNPDVSDDIMDQWPDSAGSAGDLSYEEALYMAMNGDSAGEDSDTIYILSPTVEGRGPGPRAGGLSFYVNAALAADSDDVNYSIGYAAENIVDGETVNIDEETAREAYRVFFTEHIDGNGVVDHVGDIPEYARDALESGWQAN